MVRAVPDQIFADPRLELIYDEIEGDRADLDHSADILDELGARSIIDVGCGTGVLGYRLAESPGSAAMRPPSRCMNSSSTMFGTLGTDLAESSSSSRGPDSQSTCTIGFAVSCGEPQVGPPRHARPPLLSQRGLERRTARLRHTNSVRPPTTVHCSRRRPHNGRDILLSSRLKLSPTRRSAFATASDGLSAG